MSSTSISFRILAPLYQLHAATLGVPTTAGPIELSFTITESGLSAFKTTSGATIPGDDIGALHNTIVTATLPGTHDVIPVVTSPDKPSQVPVAVREAVTALNIVIDHYRDAAGAPQIRRVPYHHARGSSTVTKHDDGTQTTQHLAAGNGLAPTGPTASVAEASAEFVATMQARIDAGSLPLWKSITADSQAELAVGNTRSGLAHLYMAFEMLAATTCLRLGEQAVGRSSATEFLEPAVGDPPVIFKIVMRGRDWASGGPSKNKLNGWTHALMQHRNGVMHGGDPQVSPTDVAAAFEAFETLSAWMESASPTTTESAGTELDSDPD